MTAGGPIAALHLRVSQRDHAVSMPFSLRREDVLRHFAAPLSPQFLGFLARMDQVDNWTFDYGELTQQEIVLVNEFITSFERAVSEHGARLHEVMNKLIHVLGRVTTSRCMYVVQYLTQSNTRFFETFVRYLDSLDSAEAVTVRDRLRAFYRSRLLAEVFSGARLRLIASILQDDLYE